MWFNKKHKSRTISKARQQMMKILEWMVRVMIAVIFVTALIICFPIVVIGDIMNKGSRRIKK